MEASGESRVGLINLARSFIMHVLFIALDITILGPKIWVSDKVFMQSTSSQQILLHKHLF